MDKWEYMTLMVEPDGRFLEWGADGKIQIVKHINVLGDVGWELVSVSRVGDDYRAWFKRPLQKEAHIDTE